MYRTNGEQVFPPEVRLRKRSEFLRLAHSTEKYAGRGILVVWLINSASTARLGITVSKKIGCAVSRNRIKRVIRDIFRRQRTLLPTVDINVIARSGSSNMSYQDFSCELYKAFERICTAC